MPLIYEGICSECSRKTGTCGSYRAIIQDDRSLSILRHPCEDDDLKNLGLTWAQAGWQGRHTIVRILVCRKCGGLYERRIITFPEVPGTPLIFVAVAVVATLVVLLATDSICLALIAICVGCGCAIWLCQKLWTFLSCYRARKAGRPAEDGTCCDTPDLVCLKDADEIIFPCTSCGAEAVKFKCVGIS